MQIDLTIKNYRCFSETNPARISIKPGFTGFIGTNNSGKSSLLKFFFEFRSLFSLLATPMGNLVNCLGGSNEQISVNPSGSDHDEVFSNTNDRNLELIIEISGNDLPPTSVPLVTRIEITIERGTRHWKPVIYGPGGPLPRAGYSWAGNSLISTATNKFVADLSGMFTACSELRNTFYIGPFRNAINTGTNQAYYDIQVGQAFVAQWRHYKTGPVKKNEASFKLTEDIKRIFEFNV